MKILYLITKSEIGGAQTHVAELCNYFKIKNHEVVVMSSGNGWLKNECDKIGVSFVNNKFFSNSANPARLYRAMKEIKKCVVEFKPDIIHCHSSAAGFLGRIAIKNTIPTVFTAHGWAFDKGTPLLRRIVAILVEKAISKYCFKIICVSNFTKQEGLKWKVCEDKKMEVIYNGVSLAEPDKPVVKNIQSKIKLIFVGRFSKQKNPLLFLKALVNLPEDCRKNLEISLIGNGPDKKKIEKFIKNFKSLPKTEIFSTLTPVEVKKYLAQSDVFVLITNWEGFPYTILEAMSCGLPVIASDVGGINEAVNEQNGILVNNEVGQIREAILKLVNDKDLRLRLGKQGRQDVIVKFSSEQMLEKISKVYNNIEY